MTIVDGTGLSIQDGDGQATRDRYRWETTLLNIRVPSPQVWFVPGTGNVSGNGSSVSPWRVSNAAQLDAILRGHFLNATEDITFRFADGLYHTAGLVGTAGLTEMFNWAMRTGWCLYGESREGVTIKGSTYNFLNQATDYHYATCYPISSYYGNQDKQQVCNLTVDCNWTGFMTQTTAAFTQPANNGNVTVPVIDPSKFVVGKWGTVQKLDGTMCGTYDIVSTTGSSVVLKNVERGNFVYLAAGSVIPAGSYAGTTVNTGGVILTRQDALVDTVRVTNAGVPHYEAHSGIIIYCFDEGVKLGRNVIRNCIVDNLWGAHGWAIGGYSNNVAANNGTFLSLVVEDNVIRGNGAYSSVGYGHQGLWGWGLADAVFKRNCVTDCHWGFFNDVGFNERVTIEDNFFSNNFAAVQAGGGYVDQHKQLKVKRNKMKLPHGGFGVYLNGEVHESRFDENEMSVVADAFGAHSISVNSEEYDGNVVSGNIYNSGISEPELQDGFTEE